MTSRLSAQPPQRQRRYVSWRRAGGLAAVGVIALAIPAWAAATDAPPTDLLGTLLVWMNQLIRTQGLWLGLVVVFAGGILLNLTPCVYPMVPVTLAFFSQQAGGRIRTVIKLAVAYVLGIACCYAALGLFAAQTGALLGSWLQQPLVLVGVAAVIVGLALSMFGLYELRPPAALLARLGQAPSGYGGAVFMGVTVGIVAAPCVGPFLAGLLLLVSELGNPWTGFLIFFVLGIGMGVPSVALAVGASRARRLPKAGEWMVWVKRGLGVVLLGVALWLVRSLVPKAWLVPMVVVLLAGAGAYLGWLERSRWDGAVFRWVRRLTGAGCLAAAVVMAWPRPSSGPAVHWQPFTLQALQEAADARQPVVVDAYADWCLPCVEMDHVTFHHPTVIAALQSVVTLRIDATRGVPEDAETLFKRYDVFGVPTVLLFDRRGRERRELRLLGFVKPDKFLERLRQIQ